MSTNLLVILSVVFFFAKPTFAVERVLIPSKKVNLDAFIYEPTSSAKGLILVIGGSGPTRGGFGGPSKFSKTLSENGFVAIEWNKRGITTNSELSATETNQKIYNSAVIGNIFGDAQSVLAFAKSKYPNLPVFVLGGSEGSITTTLLAQYNANDIKARCYFRKRRNAIYSNDSTSAV